MGLSGTGGTCKTCDHLLVLHDTRGVCRAGAFGPCSCTSGPVFDPSNAFAEHARAWLELEHAHDDLETIELEVALKNWLRRRGDARSM